MRAQVQRPQKLRRATWGLHRGRSVVAPWRSRRASQWGNRLSSLLVRAAFHRPVADTGLERPVHRQTGTSAVQLLYRQIKLQRGLPFDVRIPNTLTAHTLKASKAGKNVKRFRSKKEVCADLGL